MRFLLLLALAATAFAADPMDATFDRAGIGAVALSDLAKRDSFRVTQDGEDVAQLEGPVRIDLDRATLSARQAVVWLRPDPESRTGGQKGGGVAVSAVSEPGSGRTSSESRLRSQSRATPSEPRATNAR